MKTKFLRILAAARFLLGTAIFAQAPASPTIILPPSSQTVCEGNSVSFVVTAAGTGLSYQWRNGNVNIINGGSISGANSATLLISAASATDASANYNVVVSGSAAPSATSSNVSLLVETAPAIITAPCSATVCEGNAATFSVVATGSGLTYQWRKGTTNLVNGGNISGATSAMLTIAAASFTDASNDYNVIVSGSCPPIVSTAYISLVVKSPPSIAGISSSQTVCAGNPVSFSVSASGSGLTYQWYNGAVSLANGGAISGANSPALMISSASYSSASANYHVVVSGQCAPAATSSDVSLAVNEAPAIVAAPGTRTVCAGNSVSFAVTATGSGLTYQWRRGTTNLVNSGAVSGVNTATLSISAASFTDAANDYNVVVSGSCPPSIISAYAALLVSGSPTMTAQPSSQTVCAASPVSLGVSASGTGLTYQWFNGNTSLTNGGTISGATSPTLMISAASATDASGSYYVVVSGGCAPAVTSSSVSLTVNTSPVIISAPCGHCTHAVCAGASYSFAVVATGSGLTYQWRRGTTNLVNGGTISGVNSGTLVISAVSATDAATDYNVIISGACPPVIGSAYFTLAVTSPATITTTSPSQTVCAGSPVSFSVSASGTGLSYQWFNGTTSLVNGGTISGATSPILTISSASYSDASNDYHVVVSGGCSSTATSSAIELVVNAQPTVTAVSAAQTLCAGSTASLVVSANGTNLTYQWYNGATSLVNGGNISGVNTPTLVLSAVSSTDASAGYHAIVSTAGCAATATSAVIALVVSSPPSVTAVSPSQTLCAGSPVSFTVSASGTDLTYQWFNGTTSLVNGGNTSGATTPTLMLGAVSLTDASTSYYVVVSNTVCAVTATSSSMALAVNPQPTITAVAASQTVCAGSPASFSVSASGTGLSYQWFNGSTSLVNGGNISGVNTPTLMLGAVSATDASNNYNVVVYSTACAATVTSGAIALTINAQPAITAVSASQTVCAGSPVSFSVSASGTGLSYQWFNGSTSLVNGGNISGATTPTLMLSAVTATEASTNYNVVISSTVCAGTVTSSAISLAVNPQPSITAVSASQTVCAGSNATFSVAASGTGLSYQWFNGSTSLVNSGTISGATTPTLMLSAVSLTDASNNYNVVVSGAACAATATSAAISLVITSPASITAVAASQTVCAGSPASFSVSVSGTGLSYQWFNGTTSLVNGGNISGATTPTLMLGAVSLTDASTNYNVVVSGTGCATTASSSAIALVVSSQPSITSLSPSQTVCAGASASFSISASGTDLSYQWFNGSTGLVNGGSMSGVNTPTLMLSAVSLSDASTNYNVVVSNAACAATATSADMSLIVNSPVSITAVSSSQTVCAGSPASFSVSASGTGLSYQWFNGTTSLVNGGNISGVNTPTLMLSAVSLTDASANYNVVVSGTACASTATSATMALMVNSPASITAVSASQTVCAGSAVSFSVSASGTGLSYQWFNGSGSLVDGGNISGATTPTLMLGAVSSGDASSYYVLVSSPACAATATSSAMALVVNSQASITAVSASQTICAGSPVSFSVSAIGTGLSYQWFNGSNSLANGGNISGATTPTLMLSAVSPTDLSAGYYAVVSGDCSSPVASSTIALAIASMPTLTAQVASQTVCAGSPVTFSVASGPGLTYQWRIGVTNLSNGGAISGATSPALMINPVQASDTSTDYNVVITGLCGASYTSASIMLQVTQGPEAKASSNSPVCTGSMISLYTPEIKDAAYRWSGPGNFTSTLQNPAVTYGSSEAAGIYSLTVSNGNCTSATATVMVTVQSCIAELFIPEGFSPNNDGINDVFVIRGIANYPANHFVVFNRWGDKVFEKNTYLSTWDGTTTEGINAGGNELPTGTYFYVLNLGDGSRAYKGTIYLNR